VGDSDECVAEEVQEEAEGIILGNFMDWNSLVQIEFPDRHKEWRVLDYAGWRFIPLTVVKCGKV
jgi:hypothetical protein